MESLLVFLVLAGCLLVAETAPWGNYETTPQQQACGDKLADIMSLVCSGRGYNNPFRPERSSSRRFRRQIVDECCRRSCNPTLLELYCKADTTEAPTNIQIRKRSDSEAENAELQREEETARRSTEQIQLSTASMHQPSTTITEESTTTATKKKGKESYKLLNLLGSSEHNRFKQKTRSNLNKSIQNDTTEEEFYKQNGFPPMRHKKNRHHMRFSLSRKTSAKAKREKNASDESKQTFQIGTVKPYFARRAHISFRGMKYVHAPTLHS